MCFFWIISNLKATLLASIKQSVIAWSAHLSFSNWKFMLKASLLKSPHKNLHEYLNSTSCWSLTDTHTKFVNKRQQIQMEPLCHAETTCVWRRKLLWTEAMDCQRAERALNTFCEPSSSPSLEKENSEWCSAVEMLWTSSNGEFSVAFYSSL